MTIRTRPFEERDVPQLLELMRQLAVFEGYSDEFRVTEADLVHHGLAENPQIGAIVAFDEADERALLGMAVHYTIAWTFTLTPTLVLKELYVAPEARGSGAGIALFQALQAVAREMGAGRINWTVLSGNERAAQFYSTMGGCRDRMWENWTIRL